MMLNARLLDVLRCLGDEELTLQQIAQRCRTTSSGASRRLQTLEKQGRVARIKRNEGVFFYKTALEKACNF